MAIEQAPFTRYHEQKKVDSFTVRLNDEERKQLEKDKRILHQAKDSTALKQLAQIGSYVLHRSETGMIIDIVFKNKSKNARIGLAEFED